ncbi:MAG: PaaI family thioesterase [Ramlibacter sp.]
MSGAAVTLEQLQDALPVYFAPWVQALGLRAEAFDADSVTLRLPASDQLARAGDTLCGQAMMAAADTAMVLALVRHFGAFRPCTTVQMNSSFLRPLSGQDALVQARVLRAGKALAFGEIDIRGALDGKSTCRASTTYALL